jgi:hypothetical protein
MTLGTLDLKVDSMFEEWAKLALAAGGISVGLAILIGGLEALIPLLITGGALFAAFHVAKGLAQSIVDCGG